MIKTWKPQILLSLKGRLSVSQLHNQLLFRAPTSGGWDYWEAHSPSEGIGNS